MQRHDGFPWQKKFRPSEYCRQVDRKVMSKSLFFWFYELWYIPPCNFLFQEMKHLRGIHPTKDKQRLSEEKEVQTQDIYVNNLNKVTNLAEWMLLPIWDEKGHQKHLKVGRNPTSDLLYLRNHLISFKTHKLGPTYSNRDAIMRSLFDPKYLFLVLSLNNRGPQSQ